MKIVLRVCHVGYDFEKHTHDMYFVRLCEWMSNSWDPHSTIAFRNSIANDGIP